MSLILSEKKIKNPVILIGHSMGGKVAMYNALSNASWIKSIIILDIAPKDYPLTHHQILSIMNNLEFNRFKKREEIDQEIFNMGLTDEDIRNLIIKNIKREKNNHFKWTINVPTLYRSQQTLSKWPQGISASFTKPTLFLKGGRSDYILPSDEEIIAKLFPEFQIEKIIGSGHWLHYEIPQKLLI